MPRVADKQSRHADGVVQDAEGNTTIVKRAIVAVRRVYCGGSQLILAHNRCSIDRARLVDNFPPLMRKFE